MFGTPIGKRVVDKFIKTIQIIKMIPHESLSCPNNVSDR